MKHKIVVNARWDINKMTYEEGYRRLKLLIKDNNFSDSGFCLIDEIAEITYIYNSDKQANQTMRLLKSIDWIGSVKISIQTKN